MQAAASACRAPPARCSGASLLRLPAPASAPGVEEALECEQLEEAAHADVVPGIARRYAPRGLRWAQRSDPSLLDPAICAYAEVLRDPPYTPRVEASRTAEAGTGTDRPDRSGVRFPPPLIYVAGFLVGVALELAFPVGGLPVPIAVAAGVIGLGLWLGLDGSAMRRFQRAGTSMVPMRPSTTLVISGPYRFTRNPMYLGMGSLYLGLALALGVIWAVAVLPLVLLAVDRLVIAREESYLERQFGDEYRAYKRHVRRWI